MCFWIFFQKLGAHFWDHHRDELFGSSFFSLLLPLPKTYLHTSIHVPNAIWIVIILHGRYRRRSRCCSGTGLLFRSFLRPIKVFFIPQQNWKRDRENRGRPPRPTFKPIIVWLLYEVIWLPFGVVRTFEKLFLKDVFKQYLLF